VAASRAIAVLMVSVWVIACVVLALQRASPVRYE
jgi:hypothetical protein